MAFLRIELARSVVRNSGNQTRATRSSPSDRTSTKVLLENATSVGDMHEEFGVRVIRFHVTVLKGNTIVEMYSNSNTVTPA